MGLAGLSFVPGATDPGESEPAWASHCFSFSSAGYRNGGGVGNDFAGAQKVTRGDVVGLLLDFDARTVAVYKNGERTGLVVQPYMFSVDHGKLQRGSTGTDGEPVPLRWCADLNIRASVRIDGPKPPPVVTAADLAEDARKLEAFLNREAVADSDSEEVPVDDDEDSSSDDDD